MQWGRICMPPVPHFFLIKNKDILCWISSLIVNKIAETLPPLPVQCWTL